MAKFIYNCEDSGFSIEVDDNGRSYALKGPVKQQGKIINNNLSLTLNTKLFCCSDNEGITLFLVDNIGQYQVFEFDHQGQPINRFVPRCGKFGSQNNTCVGCPAFITLTCCDIQAEGGASSGSDLDKEVYIVMKENDILKLYVYFSNGLSNVATPTILQSAFGSSNALEFVDINCCGNYLQIIAKDLVIQEYVSVAVSAVPLSSTITLGLFDDDLPITANFVRSFCCQGKYYFVIFEVNGQNRIYQSANPNQLGYTGTNEATTNNPFFDLDNNSFAEYLLLGAAGEKFMSMICCDITGNRGDEVIAILKPSSGSYKIYIFSPSEALISVNGASFGVATDLFINMTCCENTKQVFVTLKDVTGKVKLFGFNSQGGLVAGSFTNGLALKEHTCNVDLDLQEEFVYVFRDNMDQNFLFITDSNGDAVLCPVSIGSCGDIVQDIECCEFLKDINGITIAQMILIILKDPTRDQLRLHAISPQVGPAFAPLDIGAPGDELVKLSCCDFVNQQIGKAVTMNNDIFVVLKNKYGLHKLEVYGSNGSEFFGHTCPKIFGINGDEFFSLVCCDSCNIKKLLLILRRENHFSVYSFTDSGTTLLQETVNALRVTVINNSILFTYSDGNKNLLFSLNQDGSVKFCPIKLQDGAVSFIGHCDIDNNGLEEIVIVMKNNDSLKVQIITETGFNISAFADTLIDSNSEIKNFLCYDLDDDGRKELIFLLRNPTNNCNTFLVYNNYGEKFNTLLFTCRPCDNTIMATLITPNGPYKMYIFSFLGGAISVDKVLFGVATDVYYGMPCCSNANQIFVILKDILGKLKIFGFDNKGKLVDGNSKDGINLKEHICDTNSSLQSELFYIFKDNVNQNFIVSINKSTGYTCISKIGISSDIIQDTKCCGIPKIILFTLKDPARDQLRLQIGARTVDIGAPGDELVKISCCDFINQQAISNTNIVYKDDIFVVLKNKQGLHKLEVYSSVGTEFFGHTCPKTFGMNGEEFFSLVCCNSCNMKRLLLILRCEKHFSIFSFKDDGTKLLQETVRMPHVVHMNDSILFTYSNGDENLLFILNQDGSEKLCPVTLQDGAVQFLGHCDIDNNDLEEIIIVIKESDGLNHVYIITDTGSPVSMFGDVLGGLTDEFVDFLCCDLNDDGRKEFVFLMKNTKNGYYEILGYNNYGGKLFCKRVNGECDQFISMSCCPVTEDYHGYNDILLVMKSSSYRYMLYAYNYEGKRYHLDDLQYKTSYEEIVFKYTMGLDDYANPIIYRVNKKNHHEYCPKELHYHTMDHEG